MINKDFVEKKLKAIKLYSEEIDKVFEYSLDEIKKDFLKYRATERILQLIVDEMIDINNYLIRRLNFKIPDDFQGTFLVLANNNVLPEEFAKKLAPIVGLRNRLVHRYEEINLDVFLKSTKKEKEDFKKYIKFINQYLEKI